MTLPESPSFTESIGMMPGTVDYPRPLPLWLNPSYSKHIVKGNFMTLSARPKTVEPGEWIAHQGTYPLFLGAGVADGAVVEQYRNLWNFVRVVHEKDEEGQTVCNASTCPKMSAGQYAPPLLHRNGC